MQYFSGAQDRSCGSFGPHPYGWSFTWDNLHTFISSLVFPAARGSAWLMKMGRDGGVGGSRGGVRGRCDWVGRRCRWGGWMMDGVDRGREALCYLSCRRQACQCDVCAVAACFMVLFLSVSHLASVMAKMEKTGSNPPLLPYSFLLILLFSPLAVLSWFSQLRIDRTQKAHFQEALYCICLYFYLLSDVSIVLQHSELHATFL